MEEAAGALRIAVDARTIYARHRRGTGKNLIDVYRTLARQRPEWDFVMFGERAAADDPFEDVPNITRRLMDVPGYRFNVWQDGLLPALAAVSGASVLHCPANIAPIRPLSRVVLTIHDLIPIEITPDAAETIQWVRRVRRSARIARLIVVPSFYTRSRLVEVLGVEATKIRVNYWAPDRACRRIDSEDVLERTRTKYGLRDQPYVIAFGALDPRKNTESILRAWARVPPASRGCAVLLIVGVQAEALSHFRAMAEQLALDKSCRIEGFAAEEDIAPLLTGATALCYPSRSEGFGLPVLDGFACETPVITSTTTSLGEVAGDAALLVDPDSVDAIALALDTILTSKDVRARLQAAGRRRLEAFSWEKCAATLADALQAAAA